MDQIREDNVLVRINTNKAAIEAVCKKAGMYGPPNAVPAKDPKVKKAKRPVLKGRAYLDRGPDSD